MLKRTSPIECSLSGKQVVLDLHVKLRSGESVNIEMQNYAEKNFTNRMFAYWMRLHSRQLERGQKFSQVKPSYLLAFTNFSVSSGAHHISKATLTWDNPQGEQATKRFTLVVVQLNKFNKGNYILKYANPSFGAIEKVPSLHQSKHLRHQIYDTGRGRIKPPIKPVG